MLADLDRGLAISLEAIVYNSDTVVLRSTQLVAPCPLSNVCFQLLLCDDTDNVDVCVDTIHTAAAVCNVMVSMENHSVVKCLTYFELKVAMLSVFSCPLVSCGAFLPCLNFDQSCCPVHAHAPTKKPCNCILRSLGTPQAAEF